MEKLEHKSEACLKQDLRRRRRKTTITILTTKLRAEQNDDKVGGGSGRGKTSGLAGFITTRCL